MATSVLTADATAQTLNWVHMAMGLGLTSYDKGLMGDAMKPLRSYEPFLHLMNQMDRPLLAIVVGTLFTAMVQH